MSTTSLIQELRSRVKDSRSLVRAFGVSVTDALSSEASLEVSGGYLRVTVVGGAAGSLNVSLSDPRYDTLGRLARSIQGTAGYAVSIDSEMDEDFSALSLADVGPVDCLRRQMDLTHKLFSDQFLGDIIRRATLLHNPSFPNPDSLPAGEEELVILMSHAMLARHLASGAVRRRNMDMSTDQLLTLAKSLDDAYKTNYARLARSIQSPREAASDLMREGDVVVGRFNRKRRGSVGRTSIGNIPPETPILVEPLQLDVEDTRTFIGWQRSSESNFSRYEMWRSTESDVNKGRPPAQATTYSTLGQPGSRDVLGATGGWFECLEPSTTYFFRLYVIDRNGEYSGSQTVQVTTKALRAKLSELAPPTPVEVQAGSVVTVTFDPEYAAPDVSLVVTVGDKAASYTVTGAYEIEVIVPALFQKGNKTLRILNADGLPTCYEYLHVT